MSYYKVRAVRLKKNGKLSVTAACNNIRPLTYFTSDYNGTVADFMVSVSEGNFHLADNKANHAFVVVADYMEEIGRLLDKNGLDFCTQFEYGLTDRERAMRYAAEKWAERITSNNWSDASAFGKDIGNYVADVIAAGQKNLREVKQKEKEEGIIRISCAAISIFEGYDLLVERENGDEFMLAPEEDYHGGKLKTDPKKIIHLGREGRDMYAFLSFTGLGMSLDEYITNKPEMEKRIRERFAAVDQTVRMALDAGLTLAHVPYKGYGEARRVA